MTPCLWLCGKEIYRQGQEAKPTLIKACLESSLSKKAEEKKPQLSVPPGTAALQLYRCKQNRQHRGTLLSWGMWAHTYLPTAPQRRLSSNRALQDERKNCEACLAFATWENFCSRGLLYISSQLVVFMKETYAQHLISKWVRGLSSRR